MLKSERFLSRRFWWSRWLASSLRM